MHLCRVRMICLALSIAVTGSPLGAQDADPLPAKPDTSKARLAFLKVRVTRQPGSRLCMFCRMIDSKTASEACLK